MQFRQFYTKGLAHCSYAFGGKKECIIVDPSRDIEQYLEVAREWKLPITTIIETHLHADFVSGHMELAAATGARIYMSKAAKADFEHHALEDGERFSVDQFSIEMIDTPGHTPEGSIFFVTDNLRGDKPVLAFTGDTLLVGDVGRPDLFPDLKEELARDLYNSLQRLHNYADNVEVYPAHGAGSLCGRSLSTKLSTTWGTERLYNGAVNIGSEEEFKVKLLEGMPEAPDHFSRCSEINRRGPALTDKLPRPKSIAAEKFRKLAAKDHVVVDTRDQLTFGAAHVPGAYGLSLMGNYATFAGWVLPPDKPLLLVLDSLDDLEPAVRGLQSVGLDNVVGYLAGGMAAWATLGFATARLESISVEEMHDRFEKGELTLVDTRLKSEWDTFHIDGSIHCPAPDVRSRYTEWLGKEPLAFICNTGNRSLLAASVMLNNAGSGQGPVMNVLGGTSTWEAMGYPVVRGK